MSPVKLYCLHVVFIAKGCVDNFSFLTVYYEALFSIVLGKLIVPMSGTLFYLWSVYLPRQDICPRTL